jgi:hypothetical protein
MTRPVAGLPDDLSQSDAAHTLPYPVHLFKGSATQPAPDASSISTHIPTEKPRVVLTWIFVCPCAASAASGAAPQPVPTLKPTLWLELTRFGGHP